MFSVVYVCSSSPIWTHQTHGLMSTCVFVGYRVIHKEYLYYDPKLRLVCISRNVTFRQHVYYFASISNTPKDSLSILQDLDVFKATIISPIPKPLIIYQWRKKQSQPDDELY